MLLRAAANSCKGVADDYNATDIVVHGDLMRSLTKLHQMWRCSVGTFIRRSFYRALLTSLATMMELLLLFSSELFVKKRNRKI